MYSQNHNNNGEAVNKTFANINLRGQKYEYNSSFLDGVQIRQRSCNDPVTTGTGKYCSHDGSKGTEKRPCISVPDLCNDIIPVNGGYTEWTVFSPCTAICSNDIGHRRRKRFCTNPEPSNGGLTCLRKFSASQIQFARSKHIFAIISRPCFQLK